MSKDAAATAPAGGADAVPGKKKKGKLIVMILGATLAVAGAGGGYLYSIKAKKSGDHAEAPKKVPQKPRVFASLEPFTVNLRATGAEHFLQLGIVFEVSGNEVSEAIKANTPLIRGKVLLLLSGKTAEELGTPEGKVKLATELVAVARYSLQGAPGLGETPIEKAVTDVHFSSMIIQ